MDPGTSGNRKSPSDLQEVDELSLVGALLVAGAVFKSRVEIVEAGSFMVISSERG